MKILLQAVVWIFQVYVPSFFLLGGLCYIDLVGRCQLNIFELINLVQQPHLLIKNTLHFTQTLQVRLLFLTKILLEIQTYCTVLISEDFLSQLRDTLSIFCKIFDRLLGVKIMQQFEFFLIKFNKFHLIRHA